MSAVVLASWTSDTSPLMRDGVPVWPVRDGIDLAALRRIVSVLGGRVQLVEDAQTAAVWGPEVVVGLGHSAAEDARLYAHLTARTPVLVDSVAQLQALPAVSVVVTGYEHIDERLMDALYEPGHRAEAPGIIFSYPDDDLRRQVLARAATKYLSPLVARSRRVDLHPDLDFGAAFSPHFSILGSQATAAQYRSAFGLGAGLLTLSTHSDGIDAKLLSDLVLCPIDTMAGRVDERNAPACVVTSTCHRMNAPIDVARDSGRFLSPSDIRARVFVHDVCWGLYPAQDVQAPDWSLVRRIVNGLQVAAVLTSWEITERTVVTTAALLHDIACGATLGQALARHLATADARRHGHQMCLVGDPAVRLSAYPHTDPLAAAIERATIVSQRKHVATTAPARAGSAGAADSARVSFLLSMVDHARRGGAADVDTAAKHVYVEARAYQTDAGCAAATAVREAVADYFAARHTDLLKYWCQDVCGVLAEQRRTPCVVCGRRTITRSYAIDTPGVSSRRHTHCPNCGPVEDVPAGRRIRLVPHGEGLVRWLGYRPRREWSARLVVEPQLDAYRLSWPWPAGEAGAPMMDFRPNGARPALPVRVALLVFWGSGHFAASGFLTRITASADGLTDV